MSQGLNNEAGGMTGLAIFFTRKGKDSLLVPMMGIFDAWRHGVLFSFFVGNEMKITILPLEGEKRRTKDVAVEVATRDPDTTEECYIFNPSLTEECNTAIKDGIRFVTNGESDVWMTAEDI